uniref:ribonuclease H n=1 Tax=Latimeria chalumnae TaxID=7897 RepID=H3AXF3_LATCH
VKFKIDTGAQCNVISKCLCERLSVEKLQKSKAKLVSFSGHQIKVVGKITVLAQFKGKFYPVAFQVADAMITPVLGLTTCLEMKLVQKMFTLTSDNEGNLEGTERMSEFYVFNGLGCLEGEYRVNIDPSVRPVVHPPRKIPFALIDKVKRELDRMEELGVSERVDKQTNWVNSMVVVEKPNKIRICLDPRDLNKAIKREHHPLKTVEEIAAKLAGARVFSVLDAGHAFWQVKLDDRSSDSTQFWRFCFKRLPFGIWVFQKKISQIFESLEGTEVMMDDILLWGKDVKEYNDGLRKTLVKAREQGLTLNHEKSKIGLSEVSFIGHKLTKNGLKVDPGKVEVIRNMPVPTNKV